MCTLQVPRKQEKNTVFFELQYFVQKATMKEANWNKICCEYYQLSIIKCQDFNTSISLQPTNLQFQSCLRSSELFNHMQGGGS